MLRFFGLIAFLPLIAFSDLDPKIFQPENQPAVPLAPIDPTIELIKPIDQLQAETIRSNAKRQVDAQLLAGRRALLQDQARSRIQFTARSNTPDNLLCNAYFSPVDPALLNVSESAAVLLEFARQMSSQSGSSGRGSAAFATASFGCPTSVRPTCTSLEFALPDGLCNNVRHPQWGSQGNPLLHALPPAFQDGLQEPKSRASDGAPLPNARQISASIIRTESLRNEHPHLALMLPVWAHMVYSDLVQMAFTSGPNGECLSCCGSASSLPQCFNIMVASDDPVFPGSCLPYVRLLPTLDTNCEGGNRRPANLATAFFDGSSLYGSDPVTETRLRGHVNGELRSALIQGQQLPIPAVFDPSRCRSGQQTPCFDLGSHLGNFLPETTVMQTILLREHNRVASGLSMLNPHWSDERLFNEARRVLVAEIQHITFNEFIPIVIGDEMALKFKIFPQSTGYSGLYNMEINAQVSTAFALTAGLFYHLMWPNFSPVVATGRSVPLSDAIFNPSPVYQANVLDFIVESMILSRPMRVELAAPPELTDKFLAPGKNVAGVDLIAMLIQSGRDVGLTDWTQWRRQCGLSVPNSFTDLQQLMSAENVAKLSRVYQSVNAIDLLVGGLAENPIAGGIVGETFACILATQWMNMRAGDRFWYENFVQPSSFTEAQLTEIRKVTLARLICDNTNRQEVQPKALESPNIFENFLIPCNGTTIPHVDLSVWEDVESPIRVSISLDTIKKTLTLARRIAKEMKSTEKERIAQNPAAISSPGSSVSFHARTSKTSPQAMRMSDNSAILLEATRLLVMEQQLDPAQLPDQLDVNTLQRLLPDMNISKIVALPSDECVQRPLPCDHTFKYRTATGWCNNLKVPAYGSAHVTFRRLLAPEYDDGFNEMRQRSVTGLQLPSPRLVSAFVHQVVSTEHAVYSHLIPLWGQFIDHDLTLTPQHRAANGNPLDCSSCNSPQSVSINCQPISIPRNDPFFPPNADGSTRCMHFVRSLLGMVTFGFRQQMNTVTSLLDASNVYGSDTCSAKLLRDLNGGRLKVQSAPSTGETLLPIESRAIDDCAIPGRCFMAGDTRANVHVGLTGMHTVWTREHNRIAGELQRINPHWLDERLYQEARRIVGAMHQRITYGEWLPKVVGYKIMDKYDLNPLKQGFYDGYDEFCDPTMANEFAGAAFRFGHTLMTSPVNIMNSPSTVEKQMFLADSFFNPSQMFERNFLDKMMLGYSSQKAQAFAPFLNNDLRNRLFMNPSDPFSGFDLAALNIQRGRDHGFGGYVKYRQRFGLWVPRNFNDLQELMENTTVTAIQTVYAAVEDIDLFTGLMAEKPLAGALLSETTANILGEQFERLRKCDRFWHENGGQAGSFTPNQLAEIRKVSLAKVLCQHITLMQTIQPHIFAAPNDFRNQRTVDCSQLPTMDFTAWQEQELCQIANFQVPLGQSAQSSPCISCTCTKEGVRCQSTKIDNCPQLLQKFPRQVIEADVACVVQCQPFL